MSIIDLINSLPGAVAQGLIWGIMAIGVYITYRILDFADLTVDGSICTGGAVCVMMITGGYSIPVAVLTAFLAGLLAGLATGLFHTFMGIPPILMHPPGSAPGTRRPGQILPRRIQGSSCRPGRGSRCTRSGYALSLPENTGSHR